MEIKREQRNQDLSWFIDMYDAGKLELNPPYQRKSVWGAKDRKFFLDTIFNNYPCPAVYLQKEITSDSMIYNVVDGKQRLQTVLDFYNNKLRIPKKFPDPKLADKRWKDIEHISEVRYRFFNYSFSVEQLQCEGDVQWDEIFNRVNINQKTLKDQELRHARFNGWLISTAEKEAENSFWKTVKVSTRGRSSRMTDTEFISILMLVMLENDFIGFPQHSIDALYVKYDFSSVEELGDNSDFFDDGEEDLVQITPDDIYQFEENFITVKAIVGEMIKHNSELIRLLSKKLLTHLYSLWALIAFNLDKEIDANQLASEFVDLLLLCDKFKQPDFLVESLANDVRSQCAYRYYQKTSGASTEKGPRKERHEALMDFLNWS